MRCDVDGRSMVSAEEDRRGEVLGTSMRVLMLSDFLWRRAGVMRPERSRNVSVVRP